jgi:LysR family transcriptional regulator, hydrogen peroxide-inducible genes activator
VPLQTRGHEFQTFPLIEEKLYAALAKRRSVTLGELHGEPFLLLRDGHCFRETAVAACKRARVQPKIIFESGQFSSIFSMVCAGLVYPSFRPWPSRNEMAVSSFRWPTAAPRGQSAQLR